MSLHVLANHMASKGRNGDSMLVHMTPGEVHGLQALAMKHGGTLTINPHTGLPEASFLKSLLPMLAGVALDFVVPGLGEMAGLGLSGSQTAGLLVGGATGLATGSLSKGLMAGLGAYGGFGLGESLAGLGTAGATSLAQGQLGAANLALGEALPEQAAKQFTQEAVARQLPTTMDAIGAGAKAAISSPTAAMDFVKANWKPLAAAAAPILADQMVPTATKMPTMATTPSYIRQKLYDPYTQTYKSLAPVDASKWGSRSFSDAYTNPQTGQMATLDQRQPTTMADGGIVALADGGTPPAYTQYSNQQIADYLAANPNVDIAAATKATNADPNAVNAYLASLDNPFRGSTDTTGGSGTLGIYNQMKTLGVDPNELYAANLAANPDNAGWSAADIARGYNLDKGAYALTDQITRDKIAADPTLGYDKQWANFMDTNNYSVNDMAQAFGLSKNEVQRRYDAAKAADKKAVVTTTDGTKTVTTGPGSVTSTVLPTNATTNAPIGTTNPYGNINNPGDLTFNADGTITVQPNIPGRPYGGFSGINELTNAYTAGGGSLGYVSPVVKNMAEHDAMYNTQTGDSLDAYNYLMGKGSNPVQSRAATSSTGIMRPYFTGGARYTPKFLKTNADGSVSSSTTNPNAPTATSAPAAQSINVVSRSGATITAFLGADGTYRTVDGTKYDKSGQEIPTPIAESQYADGGMAGYSVGGGLGSLGSYSDGGRLLKGPGDGVSDSIPATIGAKGQPARLADGEFVVPARIVSELGNGSTEAGAKKLYAMMDRVQRARGKTTGKNKVAANTRADKYLPA